MACLKAKLITLLKIRAAANPFDIEWRSYFTEREQAQYQHDDHALHHRDGNPKHRKVKNVVMLHKECEPAYAYFKDNNRFTTAPNTGVVQA